MLLQLNTPPLLEPVSLSEVLAQLRLDIVAPTLSSGNLVVGQWYEILSTTTNYFYTGCQVGNTFQATTATALDASDTVQLITEGAYLSTLIRAAREYIENLCGPLITQTWDQFEQHFPSEFHWWEARRSMWTESDMVCMGGRRRRHGHHEFGLGLPNVQSITSITYTDSTGTVNTLPDTVYSLQGESQWHWRVVLQKGQEWPTTGLQRGNAIDILFACGYGAAETDIPEPIRQAIILHVSNRYESRIPDPKVEGYVEKAIASLLGNYRWEGC